MNVQVCLCTYTCLYLIKMNHYLMIKYYMLSYKVLLKRINVLIEPVSPLNVIVLCNVIHKLWS